MYKRHLINIVKKGFSSRRPLVLTNDRYSNDTFWKTIENADIKGPQDWKNVRHEILSRSGPRGLITQFNIDAMTIGACTLKKEYELARSYLGFLEQEQIQLNLATLGKYLKLLYVKGTNEALSQEDEEQIIKLHDVVRNSYPVLDALTLDSVIQAVSLTNKWKLCLKLLEEVKITTPPSAASYSAVISAAFLNNEDDLAWKLFNEMLESGRSAQGIIYSSYFKKVMQYTDKEEMKEAVERMFGFIQKNGLKIVINSLESLLELLKKFEVGIHPTTITSSGNCKYCKSKLQTFELSEEEFNNLKTKVIQSVIVGKDVFNKTTPEELKRFQDFILTMDTFDVVVDGLNVAYSVGVKQSPYVTSGLVAAVVSHFVNEKKKVLILGRNHMNKWPMRNWGYVLQNATVFLTQDLSQDDPYLLYCALNSGRNTIIVTKDLMRSHKFLLDNVHLKVLFDRWLSQRQYQLLRVQDSRKPIFKVPSNFSDIAQKNHKYWHVPYVNNTGKFSWLCIEF